MCPRCGGAMTVLGFITEQPVVRRILAHLECCEDGDEPAAAEARDASTVEYGGGRIDGDHGCGRDGVDDCRVSLGSKLAAGYSGAHELSAPTRDQTIQRLLAAEGQIRKLGVRRLALFGSVVRGEAHAESDVDLLVEFAPGKKSFDRFMALSDLLERLLGYHVELVTIESLSPFIGPHILAEAADVLRAA